MAAKQATDTITLTIRVKKNKQRHLIEFLLLNKLTHQTIASLTCETKESIEKVLHENHFLNKKSTARLLEVVCSLLCE